MIKTISVISLGCDKNRVDTERMLSLLTKEGHQLTEDYSQAEIIIVNTCAFINSARKESIETILDVARYKDNKCQKLIVSGCLPQKYATQIKDDLTEVDAFLGTHDYDKICSVIRSLYQNERVVLNEGQDARENFSRIVTTAPHFAFLKIADGCDNHCTFCTIPSIRGKYHSRTLESLQMEAKELIENGASEIILVAQDVTSYGKDIYGTPKLVELIQSLTKLDLKYVRLMYLYPELVTDELIYEIDTNEKVAKYMDIPLQHYSDAVLKVMNRRSRSAQIDKLLEKIRSAKNHIAVRTTIMTGFPSETEQSFNELLEFVKRAKLEHVGVFTYSHEADTPSAKIKGRVLERVKKQRAKMIASEHYKNVVSQNQSMIGREICIINEGIDFDRQLFSGRSQYNAPDIDTKIFFSGSYADVGNYYNVKITGYDGYDLIGELIE